MTPRVARSVLNALKKSTTNGLPKQPKLEKKRTPPVVMRAPVKVEPPSTPLGKFNKDTLVQSLKENLGYTMSRADIANTFGVDVADDIMRLRQLKADSGASTPITNEKKKLPSLAKPKFIQLEPEPALDLLIASRRMLNFQRKQTGFGYFTQRQKTRDETPITTCYPQATHIKDLVALLTKVA
jgi:hypothetical protein